ncbi:MAG: hypothetical protein Q4D38_11535 [Planctomycetia bacterium]|nr:hypothetical protein [Planctomycetia bacterium]
MTIGGWICMTIAMGSVMLLFGWCCYKVVMEREEGDLSSTTDYLSEEWLKNMRKLRKRRRRLAAKNQNASKTSEKRGQG